MGRSIESPCSDEAFVVAWEAATTLAQAAELAGYTGRNAHKVANARARRLRARGVTLRPFWHGPKKGHVSIERLNWMARRARTEVL